ncbi:hypothetical protein J4475_03590 [Candidatus Woesearchaeota archaeon]|nr:hypothetical protein [Candidatus Woesearchaeota archaeon]
MPHQCVHCNTFYPDGSDVILQGCTKCSGKLFFFIRENKLKEAKKLTQSLSDDEKRQIEKDVQDIIGQDIDSEEPVVLDIESVRVRSPGTYEIDVVHLFKKEPLIYKLEEGKYFIDLVQTFKSIKPEKKA